MLGANFYSDRTEAQHMLSDYDVYVKKMEHVCSVWRKRKLPLKGKVVILNTLVFPIIYYAATNRYCPKVVIDRVKHLTTQFLWNGNSSKISLITLTQDTAKGGLRLHDFEKRLNAAKLAWGKRMLKNGTGFWVDFIKHSLNIDTMLEIFLRRKRWLRPGISQFYKDILSEWSKIYNSPPDTDISCRSEPLWNNRFVNLRSLNRLELIWKSKGIWRLNDVLDGGRPYTAESFYNRYGITHAQKLFDKLYSYIPGIFLEAIIPVHKQNKTIGLYVKDIDDKMVDFDILSTKRLYKILMAKKGHIPTAQLKWCEIFQDVEEIHLAGRWKFWYNLPYKISREVKLQSFQYRLLNRILPCNKYLAQLRVLSSPVCSYCNRVDDTFHFLYECAETKNFWNSLSLWLEQFDGVVEFPKSILEYEFMFGISGDSLEDFRINSIMLLARFYIYREKIYNNGFLSVYEFLIELKTALRVEKWACTSEGKVQEKFIERWDRIMEIL